MALAYICNNPEKQIRNSFGLMCVWTQERTRDPALSYCGCGPVLLQTPVAIWDITKVWIRLESNVSYLNFTLYSM